ELDGAELGVVERVPVDVAVGVVLVAPPQYGEALVVGRAGVPEVGRLAVAGGLLDDVPELGGPAVDAEVLVGPVVGGAAHRVGRVPGEVLAHRVRRVAGEGGADLGELLPDPHVERGELAVGPGGGGPQQPSTAGVVGVEPADVGAGGDHPHDGVDLGLAQRVVAAAGDGGAPAGGVVAVEVEPLDVLAGRDREAVEVGDRALGEHAIGGDAGGRAGRRDGHHQAG